MNQVSGTLPQVLTDLGLAPTKSDGWPIWGTRFLEQFLELRTMNLAAKSVGVSPHKVYHERQHCPSFNEAVMTVLRARDEALKDDLEAVGFEEALKPVNKVERFFHLKRLDPAYRDKGVGVVAGRDIIINMGYTVPRPVEEPTDAIATASPDDMSTGLSSAKLADATEAEVLPDAKDTTTTHDTAGSTPSPRQLEERDGVLTDDEWDI